MRSGSAVLDGCLPGGVRRAVADHRRGGDAKVENVDALVAGRLVGGVADQERRSGHIASGQRWRRSTRVVGDRVGHVPPQETAASLVEPASEEATEVAVLDVGPVNRVEERLGRAVAAVEIQRRLDRVRHKGTGFRRDAWSSGDKEVVETVSSEGRSAALHLRLVGLEELGEETAVLA